MKCSIFCDESGIIDERYMVLGGIILPNNKVRQVEAKIKYIKELHGFANHEIKFNKLNNHKKLEFYKHILSETFLDPFSEFADQVHFRCVIFDNNQVEHKKYNSNSDGIHPNHRGFYKQYYQLLYGQFCRINAKDKFFCFLDERHDKKTASVCVNELYENLERRVGVNCIKSIQHINSKDSQLLQLADLLVGAVSLEANERKSRSEKYELVEFIKMEKSLRALSAQNYKPHFSVWRFDYTKSPRYRSPQ